MKHAGQMEDLVTQNAQLEAKNLELLEEIKHMQERIIQKQTSYANFKENVFNESHIAEANSTSKIEELRILESKYVDFDIKNSADIQHIELQKIQIEKMVSDKDLEI